MAQLFDHLLAKAKQKRRRIGIAMLEYTDAVIASLHKAQTEVADVIIYGRPLDGFECVAMEPDSAKALSISKKIVQDYASGALDQFIRGQVDEFGTLDEYKAHKGIAKDVKRASFALVRDVLGREIIITLVSNPEGQNLQEKIRIVDPVADLISQSFGITPRVAVMATCRPGSYGKDPVMSKSYDEAEALVKHLTGRGIEAKNVHIELEYAITWANMLVPTNGTIGNQIFRSIIYLGKGANLASPTFFPGVGMYEDDSRNEQDWYSHVVAAAAWATK